MGAAFDKIKAVREEIPATVAAEIPLGVWDTITQEVLRLEGIETDHKKNVGKISDIINASMHAALENLEERLKKAKELHELDERINKNYGDQFKIVCAEKADLEGKLDFAIKSCKEATDGIEARNVKIQGYISKLDVADKTLKHEIAKREVMSRDFGALHANTEALKTTLRARDRFRKVLSETLDEVFQEEDVAAEISTKQTEAVLRKIFVGPMLEALGIDALSLDPKAPTDELLDVMEGASQVFKDTISPGNKARIVAAVFAWTGKPANPPAPPPGTDKKTIGLFQKYNVTRTDGTPVSWCFVLGDSDPLAWAPIKLYAMLARRKGYDVLASDLEMRCAEMDKRITPEKLPEDSWTALLFGRGAGHYRKWAGAAIQHLEAVVPRLELCGKGGCPECGNVAKVFAEFIERAKTKGIVESCDEPDRCSQTGSRLKGNPK